MQQPALQDSQKVLLVNKILQGGCANANILKSKLYLASFVMKTFERLDVHTQVELIKPKNIQLMGILDFILKGISDLSSEELKKPVWSKNSLYDQMLVSFGIMVHGLHGASLQFLINNLIQNLFARTDKHVEIFILDMLQVLFEIGMHLFKGLITRC